MERGQAPKWRREFLWTVLVAALVITGTAFAAEQRAAARATNGKTTEIQPGQIDVTRSRVYVFVGKSGRLGHEHAVEGRIKSGAIFLQQTREAGKIEFDMTSFSADTDSARQYLRLEGTTGESTRRKVNDNMLGPDVLDVRRFPTATFAIGSMRQVKTKEGEARYELKGDFTLRGQTRAITILAEPVAVEGFVRLRGQFSIRQSEFGITPYRAALGAVGVADQLGIYGDIWIKADDALRK